MTDEKLNMQMKGNDSLLTPLQKLNLMDDFLFDVTTVDLEACKIIVELSLGIRIRQIRWKEGQKVVHNLPGKRGIRMDFYVEDTDGRIFDVEMQKRDRGNIPKRTRYYQGLVDTPMLKSGEEGFDNLKPVEKSNDANVPEGCDERLIHLHDKIKKIKFSEQMEVTYMKMEERDRQIREDGAKEELFSLIEKKLAKGKSIPEIADDLETEVSVIEALMQEMDNKGEG